MPSKRNRLHLVVADGQPGGSGADQEAIDAGGLNQRDDCGVFNDTDPAPLQVEDPEAEQLREIEQIFVGHRLPIQFVLRGLQTAPESIA